MNDFYALGYSLLFCTFSIYAKFEALCKEILDYSGGYGL
jgi:hypothetical protein